MEDNLANSVIFARQKSDSVSVSDSDFKEDTSVASTSRCNFNILNSDHTSSLGSFNSFERCIPGEEKPTSFSHIRQFSGIPRTEDAEISPQSLDEGAQRALTGSIMDRHSSVSALYDGASPPLPNAKLPQKNSVSSFFANQPDAMADTYVSDKFPTQANAPRGFRDRADQSERSIIEPEGQFLEIARICAVNLAQYEHLAGFLTKINLGQPQSAPYIPRVVAPAGTDPRNALDLLKDGNKVLRSASICDYGPANTFPGAFSGYYTGAPALPSEGQAFQSALQNQKPSILRSADTSACRPGLYNDDRSFRAPRNFMQIQACAAQISEIANAAYSSRILREDASQDTAFSNQISRPELINASHDSEESASAFVREAPQDLWESKSALEQDQFCATCDRIAAFLANEVTAFREGIKAINQSSRPRAPAVAVPKVLYAQFPAQILLQGQTSPRLLSLQTDILGRLVLAVRLADEPYREQMIVIARAASLGADKRRIEPESPYSQRVLVCSSLGQQFEFLIQVERWTVFSQLLRDAGALVEQERG